MFTPTILSCHHHNFTPARHPPDIIILQVAKDYDQAKTCLLRAVDCYKEIHSIFQAGKMLDQAVLVSRDMGKLEDIAKLAERGALMYRQVNKPEAASTLLDKAAKMLEKDRPEDATGLYEKAAETVSTEDRPNVAAEYMGKAARLYVRTKDFDSAIGCLRREVEWRREAGTQAGQAVMGLILIELKRGDRVASEKVFREWGGWLDGNQARAVTNLFQVKITKGYCLKQVFSIFFPLLLGLTFCLPPVIRALIDFFLLCPGL